MPAKTRHNTVYFPNVMVKGPIQLLRIFKPIAADKTLVESWTFRLVGAPDMLLERTVMYNRLINAPTSVVGHDDLEIYARAQAGLASTGNEWVNVQRLYAPVEGEDDVQPEPEKPLPPRAAPAARRRARRPGAALRDLDAAALRREPRRRADALRRVGDAPPDRDRRRDQDPAEARRPRQLRCCPGQHPTLHVTGIAMARQPYDGEVVAAPVTVA